MESGLACQFSAKRNFVNGRSKNFTSDTSTSGVADKSDAVGDFNALRKGLPKAIEGRRSGN